MNFKSIFLGIIASITLSLMGFELGETGVHFQKTNLKESFYQAKVRNKPVFVYIGSKTCNESQQQEDIF